MNGTNSNNDVVRCLQADRSRAEDAVKQVDDEMLDAAIMKGLELGRAKDHPRRRWHIPMWVAAAAVCLLFVLMFSIRISPVFANALRDIPGLSAFVKLIEHDSGLSAALSEDYIQPLGITQENNDIRLTVEGIIVDEQRLVVLYSAENVIEDKEVPLRTIQLTDEKGKELRGIMSYNTPPEYSEDGSVKSRKQDVIDIRLIQPDILPNKVKLKATAGEASFEVVLPIDHSRFKGLSREVSIGKTIEVDGQEITFVRAKLSPLQIRLEMQYGVSNTKKINGFIDMAIEDENGMRWRMDTAFGSKGDQSTEYLFQSSYFHRPKKLTIISEGIYMTKRGERLVIDLDSEQIVQAPNSRITLQNVVDKGNYKQLFFTLSDLDDVDIQRGYWLTNDASFTDGEGATHQLYEAAKYYPGITLSLGTRQQTVQIPVPSGELPQPVSFILDDYPGYIRHPFRIDLPVE